MTKELITVKRGKMFTTSVIFSEEFEVEHFNLMVRINKLTLEHSRVKTEFVEADFTNNRNRTYKMFYMTKAGFMFLVMNTGAKEKKMQKLWDMQFKIIDAFELMEKKLLQESTNKKNLEWNKSREQGKNIRLELTDVIKEFVEYATNQGSANAKMYYKHITKLEYKALDLMEQSKPKIRDILNVIELNQLILAEDLCRKKIRKYMDEKLHYKEIYLLVKQDLENFANSLYLN
jgi:phage regulator Rha-like protein